MYQGHFLMHHTLMVGDHTLKNNWPLENKFILQCV